MDNKKGSETITGLFVFNSIFWILMIIFFGMFASYFNASGSIKTYTDSTTGKQVTDLGVDDISGTSFNILTFGSNILMIFKIMLWQMPASLNIPLWLPLILDLFSLYSLFIFVMWLRGIS